MVTYSNINQSQGIGESILQFIKGVAQLAAATLDQALSTQFGVVELGAVGIMIAVLVWAVVEARKALHHGRAIF